MTNTTDFWTTEVGGIVRAILGMVGIIIVIIAGFKAVKDGLAGKVGSAIKTIIVASFLAAIMLMPQLITSLISITGNILENILGTVEDTVNDNGGNGGSSLTQ